MTSQSIHCHFVGGVTNREPDRLGVLARLLALSKGRAVRLCPVLEIAVL